MDVLYDIIGFEGLYKINKNGDVWSCRYNRFLKLTNDIKYIRVCLNKKIFYLHRLLGINFIPNPDNLPVIDHIDQNKTNNALENLRWTTALTNLNNRGKNKNNLSGFKNIYSRILVRNQYTYHSWIIRIIFDGNLIYTKSFSKSKYTLEQVIAIRDEKYIEFGLEKYD